MNVIKGVLWGLLISSLMWAVLLFLVHGICHEVDWRTERIEKRGKINAWLCERALNEHRTEKEVEVDE